MFIQFDDMSAKIDYSPLGRRWILRSKRRMRGQNEDYVKFISPSIGSFLATFPPRGKFLRRL